MRKTLLYRLFGFGKIPAQYGATMQAEGLILSDEGVKGTATYRNFRSPQRRSNWRREWYTASIALTEARLFGFRHSAKIIDVPFSDARFRELNFTVEAGGGLLVSFDASLFQKDWSGTLEYRFFTPLAGDLHARLIEKQKA
ncbi:MAG: hypothetical protein ICV68_16330 [Pyrinomonadaceae bacterium]|nr:hypothetical protein [Pyrinomonadaceae bacterium]